MFLKNIKIKKPRHNGLPPHGLRPARPVSMFGPGLARSVRARTSPVQAARIYKTYIVSSH